MSFWLPWIIALIGLCVLFAWAWYLGRNHGRDNLIEAEAKAKQQELRADAKTTEAEIAARPKPDDWAGTVNRL